jgi:hypothetical protein
VHSVEVVAACDHLAAQRPGASVEDSACGAAAKRKKPRECSMLPLLAARLLAVGCWLLAAGCWLLCWAVAVHRW